MIEPSERLGRAELLFIAALAVACHATALRGGYVWLDHAHLEQGLALLPLRDWWGLFSHGFAGTGFYRPLLALSLSVDAAASHTPTWYHSTTLLWHALAAVSVAAAARALGLTGRVALGAGALFATHPITSLVASATAFRSESMLTASLMGLLIAHQRQNRALAFLGTLSAGLIKETGWILAPIWIAALALGARVPRRSGDPELVPVRGSWSLWLCEGGALLLVTLLRILYAPAFRASQLSLSWSSAAGTRLGALSKSALAVVFPLDATVCDAFPVLTLWSEPALAGALVLGALGWLALRGGVLGLLLGSSVLPCLQIVPVMRWWSPHYLYLPLAFVCMLSARALEQCCRRMQASVARGFALVIGLACASFAPLAWAQSARFASDAVLWRSEKQRAPMCREADFYLGERARLAGSWGEAARYYEAAVADTPGYLSYVDLGATLQNLGVAYLQLGRLELARSTFRRALQLAEDVPTRRQLVHNLAVLALEEGDASEAARLLAPEARLRDAWPVSKLVLARALAQLRNPSRLETGSRATFAPEYLPAPESVDRSPSSSGPLGASARRSSSATSQE